jgi:hypothetical protein
VKLRSTEILSVAGLAHGSLAQHKPLARPLCGFNQLGLGPSLYSCSGW